MKQQLVDCTSNIHSNQLQSTDIIWSIWWDVKKPLALQRGAIFYHFHFNVVTAVAGHVKQTQACGGDYAVK
jgi:hypothetical protein